MKMIIEWMELFVELRSMEENFLMKMNYYQFVCMLLYYNQFEHHEHRICVSKYQHYYNIRAFFTTDF